jgi:hypothetical protein
VRGLRPVRLDGCHCDELLLVFWRQRCVLPQWINWSGMGGC